MPRYIDADAIMKQLARKKAGPANKRYTEGFNDALMSFRSMVHSAPTISPDDARGVGEWEDAKQHGLCRCSVCKDCYIEKDYITQAKWEYCPSCGARMKP